MMEKMWDKSLSLMEEVTNDLGVCRGWDRSGGLEGCLAISMTCDMMLDYRKI